MNFQTSTQKKSMFSSRDTWRDDGESRERNADRCFAEESRKRKRRKGGGNVIGKGIRFRARKTKKSTERLEAKIESLCSAFIFQLK